MRSPYVESIKQDQLSHRHRGQDAVDLLCRQRHYLGLADLRNAETTNRLARKGIA